MPSKAGQQKHDLLVSSADFGTSLELKRNSRRRSSSKTSKDKSAAAVPPQPNPTSLKFRDSKDETKLRPPPLYSYLSSEAQKICRDEGRQVGKNQQDQMVRDGVYIDGELVRHMSSLPGYLQRGDNAQDKVLSFGVLDWDRLEKWKHKQNRISSHSGASTSSSSSVLQSSSSSARTSSECPKQDSTFAPPIKVKTTTQASGSQKKQLQQPTADSGERASRKVESSRRAEKKLSTRDLSKHQRSRLGEQAPARVGKDKSSLSGSASDIKNSKKNESNSYEMRESCLLMDSSSSSSRWTSNMPPFVPKEKSGVLVDRKPEEMVNDMNGLHHNSTLHGRHHSRQESIVLLLPKDFSKLECQDGSQMGSSDANSGELSSFSDVFSIEEFHLEEPPVHDIRHSCPLPFMATNRSETDVELNLENLLDDQRMPFLSDQSSLSDSSYKHKDCSPRDDEAKIKHNDDPIEPMGTLDTSPILHRKASETKSSNTSRDDSLAPRQLSFDMGRITRSFSFKESSATLPRLSHTSIKSGPTTKTPPPPVDARHSSTGGSQTVPTPARARSSPLRRLLDPLLRHRGASSKLSGISEELKNLSFKTINAAGGVNDQSSGKSGSSSTMVKAVLYLTVNNGVPVFKFLVESRNEILACSVKRLNPIKSDDPSWLYSFSSVNKTKRKSSSWKYQGSKGKGGPEFSYTVIGQLKVHEPLFPTTEWEDSDLKEKFTMTTEAVLYGVDLSKVDDTAGTEYMTNKEIGAVVIQNSAVISKDEDYSAEDVTGQIVVILPGGIHTLPNEGGPSSLISRWRSGGECDCGGWDEGCKLQILSNNARGEDSKISRFTRAYYTDLHDCCSLFLQGGSSGEESNQPVFRLAANGDGAVYSIEYHDAISSLQAFAIAVAVLSGRDEPNGMLKSTYRHNDIPKVHHIRSKSAIFLGEGTAKFATNPPHSPVGRA